jgi:hypothetical protein
MSVRTRLQRLERRQSNHGRCSVCQDRPSGILRIFRKDSPEGTPVPVQREGDDGWPCPACGWTPQVTNIVRVVVNSREEVARRKGLCGGDVQVPGHRPVRLPAGGSAGAVHLGESPSEEGLSSWLPDVRPKRQSDSAVLPSAS